MSAPRTNAPNQTELPPCPVCGELLVTRQSGPLPGCPQGISTAVCSVDPTHNFGGPACDSEPAALRKEPPALPAEVEAVLAKLARIADPEVRPFAFDETMWKAVRADVTEAATLLRRYAQAVALFEQRDSERNRVAIESGVTETPEWAQGFDDGYVSGVKLNPVIEDVTAALKQAVAEKDAEIARLTAIEERAKTRLAELAETEGYIPAHAYDADLLRSILREEH